MTSWSATAHSMAIDGVRHVSYRRRAAAQYGLEAAYHRGHFSRWTWRRIDGVHDQHLAP